MSDRLVHFLYLYNKWATKEFPKYIMMALMISMGALIALIFFGEEVLERTELETLIGLFIAIFMFIGGIGFGILTILPSIFNKLQDKV